MKEYQDFLTTLHDKVQEDPAYAASLREKLSFEEKILFDRWMFEAKLIDFFDKKLLKIILIVAGSLLGAWIILCQIAYFTAPPGA